MKDYILTYWRSGNPEVIGYLDFDFVRCLDSKRSTSDYVFVLTRRAILQKNIKQTLVATSIIEAKFITYYETFNHTIQLWNLVTGLWIINGINGPLKINCENKVTELYSKNNCSSLKSKHIDVKFLIVKERVHNGQVAIEYISIDSILADTLTKSLSFKVIYQHVLNIRALPLDEVLIQYEFVFDLMFCVNRHMYTLVHYTY